MKVHEGARLLFVEITRRRVRHVKRAEQVHLHHLLEVDDAHAVENAVAQNAGVVDDAVDTAEALDRGLDDVGGGRRLGDAVEIGDRLAAFLFDFRHYFLGG